MLEIRVLCVVAIAIDIRLNDLLDLPPGQQRRRRQVVGAADQDLARSDGVALPEATLALILSIGLEPECRIEVGHHPHPPAFAIGLASGRAVGEDLRRRHRLMPGAEGAHIAGRDRLLDCLGERIGPPRALGGDGHPAPRDQILTKLGQGQTPEEERENAESIMP